MSDVPKRPNIFASIIGWLFLVVFCFTVSRPSLLYPISFIPVLTILLCYALYTEHPSYRRIALALAAISFVFCAFTLISSSYLPTLPPNLLELSFNYSYMLLLNLWLFTVISGFITVVFVLVKVIHKHSMAMIMFLFNLIIFIAGFFFLYWFIPYMLQAG